VVWAGPSGWGKSEIVPHSSRYTDSSEIRNVPVYISGSPSARGPAAWTIQPFSDIKEVIPRAAAEAQQYYRIAWMPPDGNWNGKPHNVRVRVLAPVSTSLPRRPTTRPNFSTLPMISGRFPKLEGEYCDP
jgi:hypothetical protein